MYKKLSLALSLSVLSSVSMLASAQNLYMNDLKLKADLDWLNTQGVAQISTSTWPLTANEIKRALNTANAQTPAQQQILQSVQARLSQNRNSVVKGSAALHIQTDRDQLHKSLLMISWRVNKQVLACRLAKQSGSLIYKPT